MIWRVFLIWLLGASMATAGIVPHHLVASPARGGLRPWISGTGISGTINVSFYNLHRIKTYTGLTATYAYDPTGNLTNNIEGGGPRYVYATPRLQAVRSAFGSNYLYDLCGNMIVRHGSLTNSQALVYDSENRLTAIAQAGVMSDEFGYAFDGARLWKRLNLNPTNLQVWIGNIYEQKGGKTLFHVYANGEQVCSFETNSFLYGGTSTNAVGYYYHQDSLTSSSVLSSGTSTPSAVEVNVWYPFGRIQTASPQASFQVSRRFTGQVFDSESGLYYYNTRYYDPELARFIQGDTIIPDIANPQSYNHYSYCLNDPLRYNDPIGHDPTLSFSFDAAGMTAEERIATARMVAPVVVGGVIATATFGAATPVLVGLGASESVAAVGSGVVAGAVGDLASQGTQVALQKAGWTKESLLNVAEGYRKIAAATPNKSAPLCAEQLESLAKIFHWHPIVREMRA